MQKERQIWIDSTKIVACFLVLLGHFFQSMVSVSIINKTNFYMWFNQTIYLFHVPLFFICSGYLHQKLGRNKSYKENIIKKFISLGIPYFVFSIATWVLKNIFSAQVNNAAEPLFEILFISPSSPYWYLYALFFIFVVTPKVNKNTTCICLFAISFAFNIASDYAKTGIYAIDIVLKNEVWFVLGMLINKIEIDRFIKEKYNVIVGVVGLIIFVIVSIIIYQKSINLQIVSTLLGMIACMSILTITINVCDGNKGTKALKFFSKYTMPIFLMHTIFAAGFRAILLKLQINSFVVHTAVGVSMSIIGPIIAAIIMEKTVILEIFLYPDKFFGKRKIVNENINGK